MGQPIAVTATFSQPVTGEAIYVRVNRSVAELDHLDYVEAPAGAGGFYLGQTSAYPYMRIRISAPDGAPIYSSQVYTQVLVAHHDWPSDFTFPFTEQEIAEKTREYLERFAAELAA